MKIGVFDSGIGGKSVAEILKVFFKDSEVLYANDHDNVPYGNKTPEEIRRLTLAAVRPLVEAGCQVIVIACNTATTNAIELLRESYPDIFFVGLEPMVKPAAAMSKTGVIAVCATSATLKSKAYQDLKNMWAKDVQVIEPDCSDWAGLIESGRSDEINIPEITQQLAEMRCDVIVLGCTHYHWLKDRLAAATHIPILEPTDAIAERITNFMRDYKSFTAAIN